MTTLFCKQTLTWLRTTSPTTCVVGLTRLGVENLGKVLKIQKPQPVGSSVKSQSAVLQFTYEGYKRTASDELYHAVWDTIEGDLELLSPVAGIIRSFNDQELFNPLEEDWLVDIELEKSLQSQSLHLITEEEYTAWERNENPGLFAAVDAQN